MRIDILRNAVEFFDFMVFADIGFDDADTAHIFLNHGIEFIVNLENFLKQRIRFRENQAEPEDDQRHENQEYRR